MESSTLKLPFYAKLALTLVSLVSIFFILYIAKEIIIPLLMALLFAILLRPCCAFLHSKLKFPHVIAAMTCVTMFVILILGILTFISWEIADFGNDWNKIKENLSQMIETFQAANIKVILGGMYAPRFLGKDYYTEFDKIYPELAKKYNLVLIPFFLEGVAMHSELNLGDGAHPNANGYKIIVENNIWQYLKPALTM
ncbi:AI-2E family transporter [bacterium]|nr:MAG: AI-2E family transporter [bacterium]